MSLFECVHHIIAPLLLDGLSSTCQPPLGISEPMNVTLLLYFFLFLLFLSPSNYLQPTTSTLQLKFSHQITSPIKPCHANRESGIQGSH